MFYKYLEDQMMELILSIKNMDDEIYGLQFISQYDLIYVNEKLKVGII